MNIARVLIIAGSDSGGGAGIQADIKTVTMLGGHAMTAIAAITAQNTLGVQGVHPVPTDMVIAQMDSVIADIGVDAVKIGMIGSAETAAAVAARLAVLNDVPILFDPVMVATSGSALADAATVSAFEKLLQVATLATPNVPELEALTGVKVDGIAALEDAARRLQARTGCAILAKGGHLPQLAQDERPTIHDLLVQGGAVTEYRVARIETRNSHGTGCSLASAIATGLAAGMRIEDAVAQGEAFVAAALRNAPGLGAGHGPMGHAMGVAPFRLAPIQHAIAAAREDERA